MGISIYETRTLLEAFTEGMSAPSVLRNIFFGSTKTFATEHIDVDFRKENRMVAPFVIPAAGGSNMSRQGFQTKTYRPPLVAPQDKLTVEDIVKRSQGENIYSQRSPSDRVMDRISDSLTMFEKAIARREEIMCRDFLFTGKCVMKQYIDSMSSGTVTDTVDYNFSQVKTLSGSDKWSADGSDPYSNLDEWSREIFKSSDTEANICMVSPDVKQPFIENSGIKDVLNPRVSLGILSPVAGGQQGNALVSFSIPLGAYGPGLSFVGTLPGIGSGVEVYSYDGWYRDENGKTQPMMPAGTVLLGGKGLGSMYYGAVTQMEETGDFQTYESTRVPKVWSEIAANSKIIRLSSRPLPVPRAVDSWIVANVL